MPSSKRGEDRAVRAAEFASRLAATGLTVSQFQSQSGLTRNVIYNLSKGQEPSSPEQGEMLDAAFKRLARAQPSDSSA